MRKVIISFVISFIFLILPFNVYSEDLIFTDENTEEIPDAQEFIPEDIKEILDKYGINFDFNNISDCVFKIISDIIKITVYKYGSVILNILIISLICSVINKIIDKSMGKKIIDFIISVIFVKQYLILANYILNDTFEVLTSLHELLLVITPSFTSVLLLCGNNFTSFSSSASLSLVLTFLEIILKNILFPLTAFLILIIILEKISNDFAELGFSEGIHKFIMLSLSMITTVMMTVLSFQNILASSKDSLSVRSLKFVSSSFIPIVGSAVGEALKTVGAGLKSVKTVVGSSCGIAIVIEIVPFFVTVIVLKLLLSFISVFNKMTYSGNDVSLAKNFLSVVDIISGIVICITILTMLIIILFVTSAVNISI